MVVARKTNNKAWCVPKSDQFFHRV